jgi:hypothetical protein
MSDEKIIPRVISAIRDVYRGYGPNLDKSKFAIVFSNDGYDNFKTELDGRRTAAGTDCPGLQLSRIPNFHGFPIIVSDEDFGHDFYIQHPIKHGRSS